MILTVCPVSPTCVVDPDSSERKVCALCLFANIAEANLKMNAARNQMQKLVLLAEAANYRVKNMREKLAKGVL